jgi:ADP-ribose pyrophosphatase
MMMQMPKKQFAEFTEKDVEVVSKETVFQGFFKMVKYHFKHKRFDGSWSKTIDREMFQRGRAAALLPYDPIRDEVVLIQQIRVGALEHASPWQLEIVAGIIDRDESAEEVVRRESVEEAGLDVARLTKVTSYYPSAGGCNEMLDVYVGEVDSTQAEGIHGLDYEDEDIKVYVVSRSEAYELVKSGQIENGASIIALQWLELNKDDLRSQWLK